MMKYYFTWFFLLILTWVQAQTDTTQKLSVKGYIETYYAFDFNEPPQNNRPNVFFNHNRHNEFNINMAMVELDYQAENYRGHLGLMTGTYAETNLAAEPELLRNIYEAYAGIKLAKGLWLDAGVFSSNIGQESPIAFDNYTLTRSLGAEASPYYLAGVRVSYDPSEKWSLNAVISNGWQNIRETPGNSHKAISVQAKFRPNAKLLLNNSFFIGNESPDSLGQMRYYNNFYVEYFPSAKFKLYAGLDYGAEEDVNNNFNTWFTSALMAAYQLAPKLTLAGRIEYYEDLGQILFFTEPGFGFQTYSYSMNLDVQAYQNVLFRIEGRFFDSDNPIFPEQEGFSDQNFSITSSLAIRF